MYAIRSYYGHRRGTVHDQMGVRQLAVDFLDDVHGEDIAVGLARA